MFYSHELLSKRTGGKFSTLWLAALHRRKLTARDYMKVDVPNHCQEIIAQIVSQGTEKHAKNRMSLYLSSNLMYGVCVVYTKQVFLYHEELVRFYSVICLGITDQDGIPAPKPREPATKKAGGKSGKKKTTEVNMEDLDIIAEANALLLPGTLEMDLSHTEADINSITMQELDTFRIPEDIPVGEFGPMPDELMQVSLSDLLTRPEMEVSIQPKAPVESHIEAPCDTNTRISKGDHIQVTVHTDVMAPTNVDIPKPPATNAEDSENIPPEDTSGVEVEAGINQDLTAESKANPSTEHPATVQTDEQNLPAVEDSNLQDPAQNIKNIAKRPREANVDDAPIPKRKGKQKGQETAKRDTKLELQTSTLLSQKDFYRQHVQQEVPEPMTCVKLQQEMDYLTTCILTAKLCDELEQFYLRDLQTVYVDSEEEDDGDHIVRAGTPSASSLSLSVLSRTTPNTENRSRTRDLLPLESISESVTAMDPVPMDIQPIPEVPVQVEAAAAKSHQDSIPPADGDTPPPADKNLTPPELLDIPQDNQAPHPKTTLPPTPPQLHLPITQLKPPADAHEQEIATRTSNIIKQLKKLWKKNNETQFHVLCPPETTKQYTAALTFTKLLALRFSNKIGMYQNDVTTCGPITLSHSSQPPDTESSPDA